MAAKVGGTAQRRKHRRTELLVWLMADRRLNAAFVERLAIAPYDRTLATAPTRPDH